MGTSHSASSKSRALSRLPADLLTYTLSFLTVCDIAQANRVQRRWRTATSSKAFWRAQLALYFTSSVPVAPDWKFSDVWVPFRKAEKTRDLTSLLKWSMEQVQNAWL